MARLTLRISSPAPVLCCCLVLVGNDARTTHEIWLNTPCEEEARLLLGVPDDVPMLIDNA